MSITHNKKRIPLLNLLINCVSPGSAPQILLIKGECTFLFLNFLKIGLCNSSSNSLLEVFSFLTIKPEVFCQKIYKPLKQVRVDINHISDF